MCHRFVTHVDSLSLQLSNKPGVLLHARKRSSCCFSFVSQFFMDVRLIPVHHFECSEEFISFVSRQILWSSVLYWASVCVSTVLWLQLDFEKMLTTSHLQGFLSPNRFVGFTGMYPPLGSLRSTVKQWDVTLHSETWPWYHWLCVVASCSCVLYSLQCSHKLQMRSSDWLAWLQQICNIPTWLKEVAAQHKSKEETSFRHSLCRREIFLAPTVLSSPCIVQLHV